MAQSAKVVTIHICPNKSWLLLIWLQNRFRASRLQSHAIKRIRPTVVCGHRDVLCSYGNSLTTMNRIWSSPLVCRGLWRPIWVWHCRYDLVAILPAVSTIYLWRQPKLPLRAGRAQTEAKDQLCIAKSTGLRYDTRYDKGSSTCTEMLTMWPV